VTWERWWRSALCVVLYAVLVHLAVSAVWPDRHVGESAPVGFAAAALVLADRRAWWGLVPLLAALSGSAYVLAGASWEVAAVWGAALTGGATVTAALLLRRTSPGQRPRLRDIDDYRDFLLAVLVGSATATAVLVVAGPAMLGTDVRLMAAGTFLAHLSSYLVLLPFVTDTVPHPGVVDGWSRVLTWGAVIAVMTVGFTGHDKLAGLISMAVIPALGWAAMRLPFRDTIIGVLVVATWASGAAVLGQGGAVALIGDEYPDWVLTITQLFVVTCVLSALPFGLAAGVQRDLARRAAREAETVRRVVDNASGVAIVGTDEVGRITLWNPGAQSLLGYTPEEVLGQLPSAFHRPEEIRRLAAVLGVPADYPSVVRELAQPSRGGLEVEFVRKDGERRIHFMNLSQVTDSQGRPTGYVSTAEDITERVATQRALELALARERASVERLREVDQLKDTFVSSVSHELRTPITSITGYLELLEDGGFGELNQEQRAAIARIDANSRRLLLLIDDLLVLSRVQDRGLENHHVDLDLRAVVLAAHEVVAPAAERAGVDFAYDVPDGEVPYVGDVDQLERVLVNLMSNAVKFSPDGGAVSTSLATADDEVQMRVKDTGMGIPVEEQASLFTRFFRSSSARGRAIQGSGLGLSIAKAIVERHGGTITVESEPGHGTEFTVRLPA
jgi:PAS domain S-box-containing protein